MGHVFRIVYRKVSDPRRRTSFFHATQTDKGFQVYFPPEFASEIITLEHVSIFDEAGISIPPKQELTQADLQAARRMLANNPEWEIPPDA